MTQASEKTGDAGEPSGPIVARAGKYYRVARFVMFVLLFGWGSKALYDGFYGWQPDQWIKAHPNEKPKSQWDIGFNQFSGAILPPLGIIILIRSLYNSRGRIRLEDGIVYVPGHPPVPLDRIEVVDRELWDRKGIAYIDYNLGAGDKDKGTFRLDDFIYQREPIDQIFDAIEASVKSSNDVTTEESVDEPVVTKVASPAKVATAPVKVAPVVKTGTVPMKVPAKAATSAPTSAKGKQSIAPAPATQRPGAPPKMPPPRAQG